MKVFSTKSTALRFRPIPFVIGALIYAIAYGVCDYNLWGSRIFGVKDIFELPCVALLRIAPFKEGIIGSALSVPALLLNACIYGALFSVIVAWIAPPRKGPNQVPEPTPKTATPPARQEARQL